MSSKSGQGKSTDINTAEDIQINEVLLNKINKILKIVMEENKNLKNYEEKLSSQKICHLPHIINHHYQLKNICIEYKHTPKQKITL